MPRPTVPLPGAGDAPARSAAVPFLPAWTLILLGALAFAPVAIPGCSSGEDDAPGAGRRPVHDSGGGAGEESEPTGFRGLKQQVEELLEEAKDAGAETYLGERYGRAVERFEEAEDLVIDGDMATAERKLKLARNSLRDMIEDAEGVKTAFDEAQALIEEVEEEKAKAEEAKAEENAPDLYGDAIAALEEGQEKLEESSETSITEAKNQFNRAKDLFDQAARSAESAAADRELAELERDDMQKYKAKAEELAGDVKAPQVWSYGTSAERRGDADLKRGNFKAAARGYVEAKQQYIAAMQRVMDEQQIAEWREQQEKARQERLEEMRRAVASADSEDAGGDTAPDSGGTAGGTAGGTPPTSPPAGGGTTAPPVGTTPGSAVGSIAQVADCFAGDPSFDPAAYPNEVTAEEEALLQEHLDKLTPLGASSYDPATGLIELDYGVGRLVKDEVNTGSTPREYLEWEDPLQRGIPLKDLKPEMTFGLGGNTNGMVIFPVPFKYRVRITFRMNILLMSATGDFGIITNFDPGENRYWRTNFLNIGRASGGRVRYSRVPGEKGTKHPNYWADKTRRVPWEIEFRMPDPDKASEGPLESSEVSAVYDVGGPDESRHSVSAGDSLIGGYVGVTWTDIKFRLYKLKVCGILDKKAAVERLKEMGHEPPAAAGGAGNGSADAGGDDAGGGANPITDY